MSKRDKHAKTQAKYMASKRADGLEWLAVWVPQPAFEAFKTLARAARKSRSAPLESCLAEAAVVAGVSVEEIPDWAKCSDILLTVWQASLAGSHALDQVQCERDAEKMRKAETKASKAAVQAALEPVPPEDAPEQQPADEAPPPRRVRKHKASTLPASAEAAAAP